METISPIKIKRITKLGKIKKQKYDISVHNNSNFFANNILVHNCTMYNDYTHARSLDSQNHESRNWVKNFWSQIAHDIPIGWRICGENMFATHSIKYDSLKSYFYGFSIWNEKNECLSWDETVFWFDLLGIKPVPVLYDGIYDEEKIRQIWCTLNPTYTEGYVLRLADQFSYFDFKKCVGKFVRKNHIQTSKHWMHEQKTEMNVLNTEQKEL